VPNPHLCGTEQWVTLLSDLAFRWVKVWSKIRLRSKKRNDFAETHWAAQLKS